MKIKIDTIGTFKMCVLPCINCFPLPLALTLQMLSLMLPFHVQGKYFLMSKHFVFLIFFFLMFIKHFVCHCYLVRQNFRLIYCNECCWCESATDELIFWRFLSQLCVRQHLSPLQVIVGRSLHSQPQGLLPHFNFLLFFIFPHASRWAAINVRLLRKARSTRAPSNGCWTLFTSNLVVSDHYLP